MERMSLVQVHDTHQIPNASARIDICESAQRELESLDAHCSPETVWVHYPWIDTYVRLPDERTYFTLRTARNRDLITPEEQSAFRSGSVAIAGLSVGSAVLETIVATGGPQDIRIADPDVVEVTNLNRMRATILDTGVNKAIVAARRVLTLDPFARLTVYPQGLKQEDLEGFIGGVGVAVDEMDDIPLKFALRITCRDAGIPVVMGTDNGDSAIIDVERFDMEPARAIFHGRVQIDEHAKPRSKTEFVRLASDIIDASLFTERQAASVERVGKDLKGVPQIATAASIVGAGVAFAVRMILTGSELPSGRYVFGCDDAFAKPSRKLF